MLLPTPCACSSDPKICLFFSVARNRSKKLSGILKEMHTLCDGRLPEKRERYAISPAYDPRCVCLFYLVDAANAIHACIIKCSHTHGLLSRSPLKNWLIGPAVCLMRLRGVLGPPGMTHGLLVCTSVFFY